MSSKYWILPVPAREKFHRQPFSVTGLTFRLNVFFSFFYAFNDKTLQLTTSCNTQIKQKWHLALSLQKLVEIFRQWSSSTVSPQTKWLAQDESVPFVIIWKPSREKNHRFISFTNGTIAYIIKEHGNGVKKSEWSTLSRKSEEKGFIVTVFRIWKCSVSRNGPLCVNPSHLAILWVCPCLFVCWCPRPKQVKYIFF